VTEQERLLDELQETQDKLNSLKYRIVNGEFDKHVYNGHTTTTAYFNLFVVNKVVSKNGNESYHSWIVS
jgi:hypothetical protein